MDTLPTTKRETGESRWSVVGPSMRRDGRLFWPCRCACGTERLVYASSLRSGASKSCGCLSREVTGERATTHGESGDPQYVAWTQMKARCHRPSSEKFAIYGGRGITVCDRWRESYAAFLEDMGPRPEGHSIDRIDVNGNYEPGNCRWATPREQGANLRKSRNLTRDGKTLCMSEWSRVTGLPIGTIFMRLALGWTVERTLTAPVRSRRVALAA